VGREENANTLITYLGLHPESQSYPRRQQRIKLWIGLRTQMAYLKASYPAG